VREAELCMRQREYGVQPGRARELVGRLPPSLLDEVAEERGAWRKRYVIDVAIQGLVHSEYELGHTSFLS
jgi:hypothetical protein